jgi:hypothetical protein
LSCKIVLEITADGVERMRTFCWLILLMLMVDGSVSASTRPAQELAKPKEQPEAKPAEQAPVKLKDQVKPKDKSKSKDSFNEGEMRIKVRDMKKIIAQDKELLKKARISYTDIEIYKDVSLKQRRLARKYKSEMKVLQRRIAIHEGMVRRWEDILILRTGKLEG